MIPTYLDHSQVYFRIPEVQFDTLLLLVLEPISANHGKSFRKNEWWMPPLQELAAKFWEHHTECVEEEKQLYQWARWLALVGWLGFPPARLIFLINWVIVGLRQSFLCSHKKNYVFFVWLSVQHPNYFQCTIAEDKEANLHNENEE